MEDGLADIAVHHPPSLTVDPRDQLTLTSRGYFNNFHLS
jgi:hypothetical protein